MREYEGFESEDEYEAFASDMESDMRQACEDDRVARYDTSNELTGRSRTRIEREHYPDGAIHRLCNFCDTEITDSSLNCPNPNCPRENNATP